jgi:beta-lactamase regulating signal transducer with metallopeptidase domain
MTRLLLTNLANATLASTFSLLVILLFRKRFRMLFGANLGYFLWLLLPTSLIVLLLPAPSASLKTALDLPLSMTSLTRHVVLKAVSSGPDWSSWLLGAWCSGALLFFARLAHQQRRFIASLGVSSGGRDGLFRATDPDAGPVVVGLLRPKIVVPGDFDTRYAPDERELILAHERTHIHRGDLLVNATYALARCCFWFSPLIHIAGPRFRFDQELACDAAVMRKYPHSRKPYASAMLRTQLADGALTLGCYWPCRHPLKERIMLLKQPGARGLRRGIGATFLGICVLLVGYASWTTVGIPFVGPKFDIYSDSVQASERGVRYIGHVIVKLAEHKAPVHITSQRVTVFPDDSAVEGDVTPDNGPSGNPLPNRLEYVLFEGDVQIEVGNCVFITQRALKTPGEFRMDEVEAVQKLSSQAIPGQ